MWQALQKIVRDRSHFILTTHQNPDGDGVGSACALTEYLLSLGKTVRFICDSPIARKYSFLDYHGSHELYNSHSDFDEVDAIIVLDAHKIDRVGAVVNLLQLPGVVSCCIDHHEVEESFTKNLIIDTNACSVGGMLYTFFKEIGYPLNLHSATGIYTSVLCDTGRFCYSSCTQEAHAIAKECINVGVNPDQIYSQLFQHVTLSEAKLFARALKNMETYFDDKVVVLTICREDCASLGEKAEDLEHLDLDFIHDFNNLIEGVKCFVLLREFAEKKIRVSLRSKEGLDISPIVQSLGGGGHSTAAGLTWEGSYSDIKERIVSLLSNQLKCLQSN